MDEKKVIDELAKDLSKMNEGEQNDLVRWVDDQLSTYSDARFRFERNWYLADNFWDGNHFVWWRQSTGTIDRIKPPKGSILRQVPKLKKSFEAMANLIVANDPRWTAYPDDEATENEEQATEIASRRRMFLEAVWDEENMKGKTIDGVLAALKFPFSCFEVYTDPVTRRQKVGVWEPFDIYWKPDVQNIDDSPIVVKVLAKTPEDVKANPAYDIPDDIKFNIERRFAYSDLKEMRQQEKFGAFPTQQDSSGLLKECYIKSYREDGSVYMRLVTIYGGKIIRKEDLPLTRYPFAPLKLQGGPYFQQSYLESLMATNKSIDLIVSNVETFFHTMTRGKWLKHKNATVTRVTNENGDFVEYDVDKPEQVALASIPNYVFVHLANLEKWVEERTVSSSTTGRAPKGIRAYKAIEALKQSDFANMGAPVTFLEETLERIAELINEQASIYMVEPRTIKRLNRETPDYFQVVGENYMMGQPEGMVPISASTKVDVQVESGLSYTEEGKRQTMLELYQLGLVPPEDVLRVFRFSNVGEMLAKAQASQQVSMIDTPDFQILPDELKKIILVTLKQSNVSLPTAPTGLNRVTRQRPPETNTAKNAVTLGKV